MHLAMKLGYYDEVTPADYDPPGFSEGSHMSFVFDKDPITIKVGDINTRFHTLKLRVSVDRQCYSSDEQHSDNIILDLIYSFTHSKDRQEQQQQMVDECDSIVRSVSTRPGSNPSPAATPGLQTNTTMEGLDLSQVSALSAYSLQPVITTTPHGLQPQNLQPLNTTSHNLQPLNTTSHNLQPLNTTSYNLQPQNITSHNLQPHINTTSYNLQPQNTTSHNLQLQNISFYNLQPQINTTTHNLQPQNLTTHNQQHQNTTTHNQQPQNLTSHNQQPHNTTTHNQQHQNTTTQHQNLTTQHQNTTSHNLQPPLNPTTHNDSVVVLSEVLSEEDHMVPNVSSQELRLSSECSQGTQHLPTSATACDLSCDPLTLDTTHTTDAGGDTYIVRCPCGLNEDDGLMILCDVCNTWQHAVCFNVREKTVPEHHICHLCATPLKPSTDPTLHTHPQVDVVCNYRRTLAYLRDIHHGRLTPTLLAKQLDVDITMATILIQHLINNNIIKQRKKYFYVMYGKLKRYMCSQDPSRLTSDVMTPKSCSMSDIGYEADTTPDLDIGGSSSLRRSLRITRNKSKSPGTLITPNLSDTTLSELSDNLHESDNNNIITNTFNNSADNIITNTFNNSAENTITNTSLNNFADNTITNTTLNNSADNTTIANTLNNSADNTITNTFNNSADNIITNTSFNNSADNTTITNTFNNSADNTTITNITNTLNNSADNTTIANTSINSDNSIINITNNFDNTITNTSINFDNTITNTSNNFDNNTNNITNSNANTNTIANSNIANTACSLITIDGSSKYNLIDLTDSQNTVIASQNNIDSQNIISQDVTIGTQSREVNNNNIKNNNNELQEQEQEEEEEEEAIMMLVSSEDIIAAGGGGGGGSGGGGGGGSGGEIRVVEGGAESSKDIAAGRSVYKIRGEDIAGGGGGRGGEIRVEGGADSSEDITGGRVYEVRGKGGAESSENITRGSVNEVGGAEGAVLSEDIAAGGSKDIAAGGSAYEARSAGGTARRCYRPAAHNTAPATPSIATQDLLGSQDVVGENSQKVSMTQHSHEKVTRGSASKRKKLLSQKPSKSKRKLLSKTWSLNDLEISMSQESDRSDRRTRSTTVKEHVFTFI
ncbi:hypothetical protein Pcinc_025099 [Petrolisthes cinctipes]|uniref:HORMA domain-containing protein n=1 Tax=Petrolisthes cinctipes TaxID=88211 RepID=A0AAE1KC23_PETCI|nr:hypothetical protein Pcinc_025099 [Petrolisthes cinctipes]